MSKAIKTVPMVRHGRPVHEGGCTTADVHPDEVSNYEANGWKIDNDKSPDTMNTSELRAYAKEKEITIPASATKVADIRKVIADAEKTPFPAATDSTDWDGDQGE